MPSFSRYYKYALVGFGVAGGAAVYLYSSRKVGSSEVLASWTTNYTPSAFAKWDSNWDHREPASLVKPVKNKSTPEDDNKYNEEVAKHKPRAVRHLFLIRHGQYNVDGLTDDDRTLTELGSKQAQHTGERLKVMQIPWEMLVQSTMKRAQQTAAIIYKTLDMEKLPIQHCAMLREGAPIPPEPKVGHWRPEASQFFQDGARIEAAFRKYFHRASPEQTDDSYTLLVCHANVIRYFVCRALQFPPEAWLRMSLHHGSITWISIQPNGSVILRTLGEAGHMPPAHVTSR